MDIGTLLVILLLVLACPVGMWLMMRGGHGKARDHKSGSSNDSGSQR